MCSHVHLPIGSPPLNSAKVIHLKAFDTTATGQKTFARPAPMKARGSNQSLSALTFTTFMESFDPSKTKSPR
jgi:hypothetical protein